MFGLKHKTISTMSVKISRFLKNEKSETRPIIFKINFGYKQVNLISNETKYKPLLYNSQLKVLAENWNNDLKLPTNNKQIGELIQMEEVIKNTFEHLTLQKVTITPELLKDELDVIFERKSKSEETGVIGIKNYIDNVILIEKKGRTTGTLRNFKKLSSKIEGFQDAKGVVLTAENLDETLYLEFLEFIKLQVNKINSVWDAMKILKAVLREISRRYKIKVFDPVNELAKSDKISPVSEEKPYLDFNNIQTILDYKTTNERLQNTKLILTTLLFTGCRYSDVFKITPEYTYEKEGLNFRYARFIDQKTGKDIIIPFLKPLEDAISENKGKLPYPISDVKFNLYVKELAERAELNEEITLSYTNSQGKKEYEVKRFFEFVTSHIGRRSFITNLINYVPVTILSKITGHALTNKNVIFSYNKISLLDNAALFVKELQRVTQNNPKEFPIQLV